MRQMLLGRALRTGEVIAEVENRTTLRVSCLVRALVSRGIKDGRGGRAGGPGLCIPQVDLGSFEHRAEFARDGRAEFTRDGRLLFGERGGKSLQWEQRHEDRTGKEATSMPAHEAYHHLLHWSH